MQISKRVPRISSQKKVDFKINEDEDLLSFNHAESRKFHF